MVNKINFNLLRGEKQIEIQNIGKCHEKQLGGYSPNIQLGPYF
jgi:hypothetical protein